MRRLSCSDTADAYGSCLQVVVEHDLHFVSQSQLCQDRLAALLCLRKVLITPGTY